MGTYMLLDKDIQLLEEKAQTLKSFISAEEYEQLTHKINELKQLGIELPEDHLYEAFRSCKLYEVDIPGNVKKFQKELFVAIL